MTREEQIKKGAIDRIHGIFKCNGKYPCIALRYCRFGTGENNAYDANECGADDYESGFIDGVRYADDNPVNPWHDASKELPEMGGLYLVHNGRMSQTIRYNKEQNKWGVNPWMIINVKYWMPIPEIEKED